MLTIDIRPLPKWLSVTAVAVVLAHLLAALIHYRVAAIPSDLRDVFDLYENESFGHIFITLLYLIAGCLCAEAGHTRVFGRRHLWLFLAGCFWILGIDHALLLHHMAASVFGLPRTVFVLPLLLGSLVVPFLHRLRIPPTFRAPLLLAGGTYLAGAVGIDTAVAFDRSGPGTAGYDVATALECSLEMAGLIIFIKALVDLRCVPRDAAAATDALRSRAKRRDTIRARVVRFPSQDPA